jgi:hypothetical protein
MTTEKTTVNSVANYIPNPVAPRVYQRLFQVACEFAVVPVPSLVCPRFSPLPIGPQDTT